MFAHGPQVAFIENFLRTIDRQKAEAVAAAADEITSSLMAEARDLSLQALYPAAIEKAHAAAGSARSERKNDAQALLEDIQRSQAEAVAAAADEITSSLMAEARDLSLQALYPAAYREGARGCWVSPLRTQERRAGVARGHPAQPGGGRGRPRSSCRFGPAWRENCLRMHRSS